MNKSKDLGLAIEAAKKAGELIKKRFGQRIEFSNKGQDWEPITEVDNQAEKIIFDTLSSGSDYSILSEEAGLIEGKIKDTKWVIDPLDGTTNFAFDIPLFSISIALVKGEEILIGVVFNPITDECFYAEEGKGVYLNEKQIKVSNRDIDSKVVIFLEKGHAKVDTENFLKAVPGLAHLVSVKRFGAAALEMAYVASGRVDGFVDAGGKFWDFAAGVLLVKEAGGRISNWNGHKWDIEEGFMVASNDLIHADLIDVLAGLQ